jgi:hypothetical protein
MSEEQTDQTSVESTETQTQNPEPAPEMVPKHELKKVLDELHGYKKQAREYESQLKTREVEEMKQREEWQKVAELREQEAMKAREEADSLRNSFMSAKKYDALKAAALSNGIKPEALEDLELIDFSDQVALETTSTGRVNVLGADEAIRELKARKPYWFGKSMGNVNHSSPDVVSGEPVTLDKIMELQAEARKSGNWGQYQKALAEYQQTKN